MYFFPKRPKRAFHMCFYLRDTQLQCFFVVLPERYIRRRAYIGVAFLSKARGGKGSSQNKLGASLALVLVDVASLKLL